MNDNALIVTSEGGLSTLKSRWQTLARATEEVLRDGIDYGKIPGTQTKTLLKPGAEKLSTLFGLRPFFTLQDSMEDWDQGRFYYRYRCTLRSADGTDLADSKGSCTTMEKKYRWRNQGQTCPACKRENTIIKGRAEYGGGWLCYRKKGGCGAKFSDGDQAIEDQPRGRIENPEPYDLINTVQKMAQKRALVAAVLVATGASEFFTQDMEDILDGVIVSDEPTEQDRKPQQRQQAKKNGNGYAFPSPESAVAWAMNQGAFDNKPQARNSYDKLKREKDPGSASEMGKLWREKVANKLVDKALADQGDNPGVNNILHPVEPSTEI